MPLPNLKTKEDTEKYEAHEEKTTIEFRGCKHKDTFINETRTQLICKCGASWGGPRLQELKLLFDKSDN